MIKSQSSFQAHFLGAPLHASIHYPTVEPEYFNGILKITGFRPMYLSVEIEVRLASSIPSEAVLLCPVEVTTWHAFKPPMGLEACGVDRIGR